MNSPERTRRYFHPLLDSDRWDRFPFRHDDILIATSQKSGTTWMQMIVAQLVFQGELPDAPTQISPWYELRMAPLDALLKVLEKQGHRRFIKTHLPLDALPYRSEAKYIVVGRDTRDVLMSLWNDYLGYTDTFYAAANNAPEEAGVLPRPPGDLRTFWVEFLTRAWFDWEKDGYPFWSHRHLPNVLLVHFNDLLADLDCQMRRVADFLGIPVPRERWPALVEAATFKSMKANADRIVPHAKFVWKGGAAQFINRGTNGRWREAVGPDELAVYRANRETTLSPDCARWIEEGGDAS